jgi:hypothetical protein
MAHPTVPTVLSFGKLIANGRFLMMFILKELFEQWMKKEGRKPISK